MLPAHHPPYSVVYDDGRAAGLERVGLGKREAVTSTAPIRVLGHLTAEGVGEVRDTLDPVVRKERLEPGRRGAHRFDEETRLVAGVLVAEPPLPGCREPALVTSKVVPVGDAHDCLVPASSTYLARST